MGPPFDLGTKWAYTRSSQIRCLRSNERTLFASLQLPRRDRQVVLALAFWVYKPSLGTRCAEMPQGPEPLKLQGAQTKNP